MPADPAINDTRAICITDVTMALLAAETAQRMGTSLVLVSEIDAGIHNGGGWWRALTDRVQTTFPNLRITAILDCGDQRGAALGAIRAGCRDLIVHEAPPALVAFAKVRNVRLHVPPSQILSLGRIDGRTVKVIERFLEEIS